MVFLKISQNSQENTCVRASFFTLTQKFSCEFCEISKSTFSYRTPPVVASEIAPGDPEKVHLSKKFYR